MLYGLLVTLFVFVCILLILVILIQQGKGGLGLGAIGGGAQMLFGGSGGQDIFQKITWVLGSMFMLGSLGLFILGSKGVAFAAFSNKRAPIRRQASKPAIPAAATKQLPAQPVPVPAPVKEAKK